MIRRALEVTGTGRHLRKERGFLIVSAEQVELARLPLDDLEVVMFAGHGMTCTGELLNTLAERCIPLVVCDQRFVPCSVLWPVESHTLQSGRIRAQAAATAPMRKRLWQQLVRAKILSQAEALLLCKRVRCERLERLAREVASGDTANTEGQAARLYWPLLFGSDFLRERDAPGVNALLNYGYTVLRSAVARAVMLAGLHPAFALHHHNQYDTMPLVDDLIEPFRAVVDVLVFDLACEAEGHPELTPAAKQRLASVTTVDMLYDGISSPVSECLLRMTRSLTETYEGERRKLLLPSGMRVGASRLTT
jgi:CRISPR-associated protein Cas1